MGHFEAPGPASYPNRPSSACLAILGDLRHAREGRREKGGERTSYEKGERGGDVRGKKAFAGTVSYCFWSMAWPRVFVA